MRICIRDEILNCYEELPQTFFAGDLADLLLKKYNLKMHPVYLNVELRKMVEAGITRKAPPISEASKVSKRYIKNYTDLSDWFRDKLWKLKQFKAEVVTEEESK